MTDTIFKNRRPDMKKLRDFGFICHDGSYIRTFSLQEGQFEMTVSVSDAGEVASRVTDTASGEEYVLHRIAGFGGAFADGIKREHEAVLRSVCESCFERDIFKSEYAKRLIQHVREVYRDEPEYLWERFPSNAVWRRKDNRKWYGALLTVSRNKLGLTGDEETEIIDLRVDPERPEAAVDGKRIFPGYHMNKKRWITICLDGTVPLEELYRYIESSYRLAARK